MSLVPVLSGYDFQMPKEVYIFFLTSNDIVVDGIIILASHDVELSV